MFAAVAFLLCTVSASAQGAVQSLSTPPHFDISKITCKQFLNASLSDRGLVMMLYWGYQAGKSGTTAFTTADLRSNSMKVTDQCAKTPSSLLMSVVQQAGTQ